MTEIEIAGGIVMVVVGGIAIAIAAAVAAENVQTRFSYGRSGTQAAGYPFGRPRGSSWCGLST